MSTISLFLAYLPALPVVGLGLYLTVNLTSHGQIPSGVVEVGWMFLNLTLLAVCFLVSAVTIWSIASNISQQPRGNHYDVARRCQQSLYLMWGPCFATHLLLLGAWAAVGWMWNNPQPGWVIPYLCTIILMQICTFPLRLLSKRAMPFGNILR